MKKTYLSILLAGCLATPILAGCANNENASSNVSASETADTQAVDPDGTHTVVDHAVILLRFQTPLIKLLLIRFQSSQHIQHILREMHQRLLDTVVI